MTITVTFQSQCYDVFAVPRIGKTEVVFVKASTDRGSTASTTVKVLGQGLPPDIRARCGRYKWTLQQEARLPTRPETRSVIPEARTCSSLSRRCGRRTAGIWTRFIMSSGCPSPDGLSSSKFRLVDELKRAIVEAWRKLPQSIIDKSVSEWRRPLDCVVWQNCGQIEHMFKWHVKCWFCVLVLLLWVCFSVIWCHKRTQTIAVRDLLCLLSFTR